MKGGFAATPRASEDAYSPLLFLTAEGLSLEAARGRAAQLVLPDALRPELVLRLRVRPQDVEPLRAVGPRPIIPLALMAGAVGRAVVERLGDGWLGGIEAVGSGHEVSVAPHYGSASARWAGPLPARAEAWMKAFAALTTIELDVTLRWAARPRPPRPGAMVMAHYR